METLAIAFTPLCQCLSEETLKCVGPFYRVSMPGEEKYPTQGANVYTVVDSVFYLVNNVYTTLIKDSVCVNVKVTVKVKTYRDVSAPVPIAHVWVDRQVE